MISWKIHFSSSVKSLSQNVYTLRRIRRDEQILTLFDEFLSVTLLDVDYSPIWAVKHHYRPWMFNHIHNLLLIWYLWNKSWQTSFGRSEHLPLHFSHKLFVSKPIHCFFPELIPKCTLFIAISFTPSALCR